MKLKYLLPICMLAAAAAGQAMPAYPGLISATQPDGTPITLRLHGDEHFCWAESADGFTLLRDADNYWTIAAPDGSGILRPSRIRLKGASAATLAAPLGVTAKMPVTDATVKAMAPRRVRTSDLQVDCSFPPTGKRKLLMLLINYSDTKPIYSRDDFDRFMNEQGYKGIGSFRDFYLEDSYGMLDVETTVAPWVTMPMAKYNYTDESIGNMIEYALNSLQGQINLADFDNDGDGVLDGLAIIHQGPGQEATSSASDIWSHSSSIYGLTIDGIQIRRYTIQPELFGNSTQMSDIGVICHEFGHNLGAPDFYDTDYSQSGGEYSGTGVWDLLGSGAWNGTVGDQKTGCRPAHSNMWQKVIWGWVTPTLLTESQQIENMADATSSPAAYRFDTTSPGDYFIIENRQATGAFNSALPGHGLIITHANEDMIAASVMLNTLNAAYPQACYTVAANATSADPTSNPTSYGYVGQATALFPAGGTAFGDRTTPAAHAIDGRHSYKRMENIRENTDGTISFSFVAEDVPASPTNLKASAEGSSVTLSWTAPSPAPQAYNIYRNGQLVTTLAATSYKDSDITGYQSKITYTVDALYSDSRLSPPVEVSIRLPQSKVAALTAPVHEQGVKLNFELLPSLSRMQNTGQLLTSFQPVEVSGSKVEIASFYRPEDLVTYQGMKIRRIALVPYQSLQESAYTLRVYETDADGSNPVVVSERNIKEMGTGIWNTIMLTTAVEIKPGKGYLTAIEIAPKSGVAIFLTENSDLQPGLGNLMRVDEGEWQPNADLAGDYAMYAILADAVSEEPAAIEYDDTEVDPDTDLYFPIGFRVYRDGQYIGETSSRTFIDSPRPGGTHSYSVSTLYKGNSETAQSTPVSVNTDVVTVGIESIEAPGNDAPLYRPDGTRATEATRGLLLRKGEKILK